MRRSRATWGFWSQRLESRGKRHVIHEFVTFLVSCGTLPVIQWRSCDAGKGGYNDGLRIFACRFALEGFPVPRTPTP